MKETRTYTPDKDISQKLSFPKRDYHGTLPQEMMQRLCYLRLEAIISVEKIFELDQNAEDATFLVNSLIKWKEGNFGKYVEGKSFTPGEIEEKIKKYSKYVSPKKVSV